MSNVWIIHREPRFRAALARLAGVDESAVQAAPSDPALASAPPADVVVLGLGDDYEVELQFAHRCAPRLPGARWVLLPRRADIERARRLFDTLDRVVLAYPPDARSLREVIHAPREQPGGGPAPLSARPARDALSERFARWFSDLELPELLRILDPRLADVHVLISGEPGTGRGLLARYIHTFSGTAGGALIELAGTPDTGPEALLEAVEAQGRRLRTTPACCSLLLEDADALPAATQARVRRWIDFGLPPGVLNAGGARWIGTAAADLEPGLGRALGRFRLGIPPIRERAALVTPFVADTSQSWAVSRGERPRSFGADAIAALGEYPWPGNLQELEDAVVQTLLASAADPLSAADLRHDGSAFAPLAPADLGVRLADEEELVVTATAEPEPAEMEELVAVLEPEPVSVPDDALRRLVGAVAHEIRNPLTTIRTFSELLPRDHADPEFRQRFAQLVGHSVDHIDEIVGELDQLASLQPPSREPVDVAGLLEELLDARRELIHRRNLVVLKELDRAQPLALGDPAQLRAAFDGLLRKCLEIVPERGDVYFASRHHDSGLRGQPSLRVLVRFHGPPGAARSGRKVAGVSPAENAVEFALAEAIARAHGGSLAVQSGDADETVLVLDLPAPG